MSHKKIGFHSASKLMTSIEGQNNDIGLISNNNSAIVKSFRLRKTDIEKLNMMEQKVNNNNDGKKYNVSDIVRGAIYLLSIQDINIISENIQKNK